MLWLGELTYASSIASAKVAILSLYWRIFQYTNIRIPIQALLVAATLWFIVRTSLTIFQCFPVEDFWNESNPDANCHIDVPDFSLGSVLVHCLMDVTIFILPMIPVSSMHLSLASKLAVIGMFSSGVM